MSNNKKIIRTYNKSKVSTAANVMMSFIANNKIKSIVSANNLFHKAGILYSTPEKIHVMVINTIINILKMLLINSYIHI